MYFSEAEVEADISCEETADVGAIIKICTLEMLMQICSIFFIIHCFTVITTLSDALALTYCCFVILNFYDWKIN